MSGSGWPIAPGTGRFPADARDYAPLRYEPSQGELGAFRRSLPPTLQAGAGWQIILVVVIAAVFGGAFVVPVLLGIALLAGPVGGIVTLLVVLGAAAGLTVLVVHLVRSSTRRTLTRWLRLARFAGTNGYAFTPRTTDPYYPGMLFGIGRSKASTDRVHSRGGRFFDIGNYTYTTGSGKSSTTHNWGYVAAQLDRRLPHMVLDATSNNSSFLGLTGSNLPIGLAKDQVLSLEGDFDRYFTLYCPRQYETDALYVFTPDLMALCIDQAAPFDLEIVDDLLFVYSGRAFRMDDEYTVRRIFAVLDTVGAKALRQTSRYRDDEVPTAVAATAGPAGIVAAPGRRLRRRVPIAIFIILGIFALFWVAPYLFGFLGWILRLLTGGS